ncbi:MAG: prepilin peptidase dependent protein type pilus assembly protein PilA [Candidatus Parcubacteria bacterium]|nr:prepilin peptidase dependent protein type pilus assembly protein PilA [Candidatus Parcubacteria bacterium]
MKKLTRGFTLIELLVVIAIIGILASIVLVSLNSARAKGSDTRIISDVQQARTAIESGFNGLGYPDLNGAGTCIASNTSAATFATCVLTTGPDFTALNQLNADATNQGGALFVAVAPNNTGYAIRGRMKSNASTYFCIDSTGKTNQSDVVNSNGVAGCN